MTRPLAVMFLGAGFSKGFGLPLTSELWDLGFIKHKEADRRLPWEPVEKSPTLKACVDSGVKNVEVLFERWLQEIDEKWGIDNFNECGQAGYTYYITNLCMHLETMSHALKTKHKKLYDSLTLAIHRGRIWQDLAFVTTNYDLCIEILLRKGTQDTEFSYTKLTNDVIPIRKLHGSINWTAVMPASKMERHEYIGKVKQSYLYQDNYKVYDIKLGKVNWSTGIIPPVIIPPEPQKTYREIFERQQQEAGQLLKRAKRVLFVGYSFPNADTLLSGWLKETMKDSKAEVTVVNPDAGVLEKAKAVFKGNTLLVKQSMWDLSHFEDVLEAERRTSGISMLRK